MIKYLFLLLTMMAAVTTSIAQVFTIYGFDGSAKQIHLYAGDETLTFTYLNDTLHVADFNSLIGKITVCDKNFLKVIYRVRAGTGIDDQHTLLLCINDEKLCQALYLTSVFDEDFIDYSEKVNPSNPVAVKTRYKLLLDIDRSKSGGFNMNVKIHDERKSKLHIRENYNIDKQVFLKFDPQKKIFYNGDQTISHHFKIFDPKTQTETNKFISGTFPAIELGKSTCFFIKDEWYEKNEYGDLSIYTYK